MNDATHPIGHDPLLRWWSGIPPASPATPLPGADRFFHPDSKQNDRAYVEKPDDVLAQAQRIITAEGLGHLVTVELRDYRDLQGEAVHDKVASVGMFKHAGLANLPADTATVPGIWQLVRCIRSRSTRIYQILASRRCFNPFWMAQPPSTDMVRLVWV